MQTRRRKKAGPGAQEAPVVDASGEPPKDAPASPQAAPRPGQKGNGQAPQLPIAWGNIVADALKIKDPAGLAKRLRAELELGEHARTDYGQVLEALDRSARNFDAAGRLHRAAKLEEQVFEGQVAVRLEAMRSAAQAELAAEYQRKERRSPTQQDIEDRMVQSWPDEYTGIKRRVAELHGAVRALEILRDAWASRCADVRIMADKARPVR